MGARHSFEAYRPGTIFARRTAGTSVPAAKWFASGPPSSTTRVPSHDDQRNTRNMEAP